MNSRTCGDTNGPSDCPISSVRFDSGKKLATARRTGVAGNSARKN